MNSNYPYWIHQRRPQIAAIIASLPQQEELPAANSLLLQAVVIPGGKVAEGVLIEAVALPWFEIFELIQREPSTIYQIDWRKWEEFIAGAYTKQGFEVVLTPRSGDGGRDVIATSTTLGSICFFDQVKAYGPNHLVTADEVRGML